jgi:GT2 family glycosyltransferase
VKRGGSTHGWNLPSMSTKPMPYCSAVIVAYRNGPELATCVVTVLDDPAVGEIIVVDNSPPNWDTALPDHPKVTVIAQPDNPGFAGGANIGADAAGGDVLVFLNPDVEVGLGALGKLRARLLENPGVAGPAIELMGSGGALEYGGTLDLFTMPRGITRSSFEHSAPLYVSGCCLATNRCVFDRVGGFDGRYFMFFEDIEYSWQCLRHGYVVDVVEDAVVHHSGGASTPGGYLRGGHIEVTAFRIALRERNSLAMVLACAPTAFLPLMLILSLFRSLVVAGAAAIIGRVDLTRSAIGGLMWNVRHLSGTLARRRSAPRSTASNGWSRIRWRCFAAEVVIRWGLPRMVDSAAMPSAEDRTWSPPAAVDD